MSMQINRNAYEKLISEDVKWLESKTDDCLERRHITNVLTGSIELVYGKKREPEGRQDADGHPGNSVIDLNGMLSSVKESIEKTVLDVLGENGVVDVNGKEVLLDTFDSVTDDFYLKVFPLKAVFADGSRVLVRYVVSGATDEEFLNDFSLGDIQRILEAAFARRQ